MAKYDEFGRPIYETAEEYNKAHKTGSARRTYDSPEGDNYQHTTYQENRRNERAAERRIKSTSMGTTKKTTSTKNTKKVIIICAVILIFVNMAVVSLMFNLVRGTVNGVYEDYEEDWPDYDESWVDEDEGYGEYLGEDATPLAEGFETFSYNGVTYSVPMSYQEVAQMGFTFEEAYDESYIVAAYSTELVVLNGEDGFMAAMVRFNNDTDEELPLSQCIVDYFYMENNGVFDEEADVPDFVFGNGFTMNSSYEELEAYFGVPYYQYIDDDQEYGCYESYEWVYDSDDEYHCLMVTFWDGTMSDVSIEKYEY